MPMENDEHEQLDNWVSAALAPERAASARVVASALGASDVVPARPWRVQFLALAATGLALAALVAVFAWSRKPVSPALVIIAGQSPARESGASYVMVVPVQKEVR
jgi:hypothetical protein